MRDLDAVAGQVMARMLIRSHLLAPDDLASMLAEEGRPLGISAVRLYLADLQQSRLRAMPGGSTPSPEVLSIDATVAGRAYQTLTVECVPADGAGQQHVWIPLVDGTERLGVLELLTPDADAGMLDRYRALAALAGMMIVSNTSYSDTYAQTQRSREMALQGELVWAFLAPRTFATEQVLVAATLEPAYQVGGDAYDYSLTGQHLHVSIFDAVGHDLAAGLLVSVGLASCRSTRRAGGALPDIVADADRAIAQQFGESRFVTALLCSLDITTGQFSWIPCGHPPPLLIRADRVIMELTRTPQLPLGLGEFDRGTGSHGRSAAARDRLACDGAAGHPAAHLYTERLEPGDRLLLYTDGIIEGHAPDGTPFGLQRLTDFFIQHDEAGIAAPETLRRLNHAIADYQHGRLSDDATLVMVEWRPDQPGRQLVP